MKLFHGSPVREFVPTYGLGRDDHDYGRGFYLTADRELGREWAVGQQSEHDGWLHAYELVYDLKRNKLERVFSDLLKEEA